MAATLESRSPNDNALLMASLIRQLVPQPTAQSERAESFEDKAARDQLLAAVKAKLRIRADDESESARGRILEYLTAELSAPVLRGPRAAAAKGRLGSRGALPPSEYEIKFADSFALAEDIGVRRRDVARALRSPTAVQHLQREEEHESLRSLYVLTDGAEKGRHSLLITTVREGAVQTVHDVLRVYHSDVDITSARTPLEVLRAFAEVYGVPFLVGNSDIPVMFVEHKITYGLRNPDGGFELIRGAPGVSLPTEYTIRASMKLIDQQTGMFEISLAFGLDMHRYREDLKRHGVRVGPRR
jgi:hypothetical protein